MEKVGIYVDGKYILDGVFTQFDQNRSRGRFYYTDIEWDDMRKHIKRIIKINKIWKKDTH